MTPGEALAYFDSLEPLDTAALHGTWAGAEFPTGHALDGVLPAYGWRGKRFDGDEDVHPLLFGAGARPFAVRPRWLIAGVPLLIAFPVLKKPGVAHALRPLLRLAATSRPRARLRLLQFRGKASAAMVYDEVPVIDVFRRVDDTTVLGLMDLKGMPAPFFFLLRRPP